MIYNKKNVMDLSISEKHAGWNLVLWNG